MSVDFNALFSVTRRPAIVEDWLTLFSNAGPATAKVIEKWKHLWSIDKWETRADPLTDGNLPVISVLGPGGFWIRIAPLAAEVYHCSRWDTFCTDTTHRQMLRDSCIEIAEILGSGEAIYLPELVNCGFDDGRGIREMQEELLAQFGPPAPTLDSINGMPWESGCYYIDRLPNQ